MNFLLHLRLIFLVRKIKEWELQNIFCRSLPPWLLHFKEFEKMLISAFIEANCMTSKLHFFCRYLSTVSWHSKRTNDLFWWEIELSMCRFRKKIGLPKINCFFSVKKKYGFEIEKLTFRFFFVPLFSSKTEKIVISVGIGTMKIRFFFSNKILMYTKLSRPYCQISLLPTYLTSQNLKYSYLILNWLYTIFTIKKLGIEINQANQNCHQVIKKWKITSTYL